MIYEVETELTKLLKENQVAIAALVGQEATCFNVRQFFEGFTVYIFTGADPKAYTGPAIASMSLSQFPGNGDIVVSNGVEVSPNFRNKGVNTLLNAFRIRAAKSAGASALMATVRCDNKAEQEVLKRNGWITACDGDDDDLQVGEVNIWLKVFSPKPPA